MRAKSSKQRCPALCLSKANGFGRKTSFNFGEDLFFFFFGDHQILGGKIVRISDFG